MIVLVVVEVVVVAVVLAARTLLDSRIAAPPTRNKVFCNRKPRSLPELYHTNRHIISQICTQQRLYHRTTNLDIGSVSGSQC